MMNIVKTPLMLAAVLVAGAASIGVYSWRSGARAPEGRPPVVLDALSGTLDPPAELPRVRFTDVTHAAGIRFTHHTGGFGQKLLPETMGSGVAFIDYDRDGRQDLVLINSCDWPGTEPAGPRPTMAVYHNEGKGRFRDVTRELGLDRTFYGMGVAVGDYDNDGFPDLFVTGVGGNHLFHNEGGKRFVDVTARAGVGGPGGWPAGESRSTFLSHQAPITWSTSAAFLDYDNDGKLDLFVCNYIQWSPVLDLNQHFSLDGVHRAYGPPTAFQGAHCILYHNRGDGRFEDVSARAGIQRVNEVRGVPMGKALGVAVCDIDGDGWPDIAVANDTVQNFLFHNQRDGTFEELGVASGIGFDVTGQARGAMGADWGEYRNDGTLGLAIGNFTNEMTALYVAGRRNRRRLRFDDQAIAEGLGPPGRLLLKFGLFFFDYDLDGRLDLLTCNGNLDPEISKIQASQTHAQAAQLFWNCGEGRRGAFLPVDPDHAGADLFKPIVGRGSAYADIDGDGFLDVILTSNGGRPLLLHNDGVPGRHWIRVTLEGDGRRTNRSAIGAVVDVESGGVTRRQRVTSGRSYLSQSELPLTFGLGSNTKVDRVTIHWPGGGVQTVLAPAIDRAHTIRQSP